MKRILNIPGAINLRELGDYQTKDGKTIKKNKLLRSGDISRLDDDSLNFLKNYGLKYVVDLRSDQEQLTSPDVETDFYKIFYDSVYPLQGNGDKLASALNNTPSYLGNIYQSVILDKKGQQAYSYLFDLLLKNDQENQALLFHCAAGKDRTGIAAMLILRALGVDSETITRDYLLTNLMYSDTATIAKLLNDEHGNEDISKMNMTKADWDSFRSVFDAIDHYYGSFEEYLDKALNINQNKLNKLKNIYLN
ncbi:tyrosine-protein phosphatase [Companilactobacillus metriopterae]|uniref:tyrosine-protein phosphatase n=1 Tax=Companilactobacillus metriopterae TaxID=1909267 RepID=UPI00100A7B89|nr:tyrosine-protein phosphatase [Companilactobacillus metriopterae]